MIGTEDQNQEEEPVLKVTDRRKFNADGSIREGVVIDKEEPKQAEAAVDPVIDVEAASKPEARKSQQRKPKEPTEKDETDFDEEKESKDPASFINFLSTLVTNAAAALGAIPHPVTGQKSVDIESGKYWIDVLTMLRKKTEGNLSDRESDLLLNILSDLQMQYVSIQKATEEKLKAQAAQKFSSKDILGG